MMDKSAFLYLLFPIFIGMNIKEYHKELLQLFKQKLLGDTPEYDLVVAILSAREHHKQRQAIRDTWLGHLTSNETQSSRVLVRFVIGQHGCPYPEEDRTDQYGCTLWDISSPVVDRDIPAVEELHHASEEKRTLGIPNLPFRVQSPIVITRLGIHGRIARTGAKVKLVDAVSQTDVVVADFASEDFSDIQQGFHYNSIDPYVLPAGFEGIITTGDVSTSVFQTSVHFQRNDGGLLVNFTDYDDLQKVMGFYSDGGHLHSSHVSTVSFIYNAHEPDELAKHISSASKRRAQWVKSLAAQKEKLATEAEVFEDIVFVDAVDVYKNIPSKLLRFHELLSKTAFSYIMKTDDDCFVDLDKVLDKIDLLNVGRDKVIGRTWWGNFRYGWGVERFGKWAERSYRCPVYPAFACGAGSVISQDLITWMVQNADSLELYQGEDVTVGIWLAAVGPDYIDDGNWSCDKDCKNDMYVMPELTPDELLVLWTNKEKCGNPCGCSLP